MAHANIYIRKENEARWNEITDKSAWVNDRLNETTIPKMAFNSGLNMKNETERAWGVPAISPSAGDHQTSNPTQPKKIADEPRYVNDEDIPAEQL